MERLRRAWFIYSRALEFKQRGIDTRRPPASVAGGSRVLPG